MLDLETWGKYPGCNLRSIGAVAFEPLIGTIYDKTGFYLATTEHPSLNSDPDTVAWWAKQSTAAQGAFENPLPLEMALYMLSDWVTKIKPSRVWANSPEFDLSIINHCYQALGIKSPFIYWTHRDVRTINDISGVDPKKFRSQGIAHHALDDAIAQARMVCEAYKVLAI
jgi:hypothetical protein